MAIYNEILVGRYARMLQKLFSIKGGVPAKQLAGEITPAFTLFSGAEHRYLESWGLFASSIIQAAVAAQFSQVQWRNPPGSNVIAVFHMLVATGQAADQPLVQLLPSTVDLGTIVALTASRMDPRGNPQPTLICSKGTSAANILNPMFQRSYPANAAVDFIPTDIDEIPLLPGDKIIIGGNVLNQAGIFSAMWRERFLEESERT